MKNARHISTNDLIDNRLKISNHQGTVPKAKLEYGSVVGLYPIVLDGGRTTIFISDVSKEAEIRKKYEMQSCTARSGKIKST